MTRLHAHARALVQRLYSEAVCVLRHRRRSERHGEYLVTRCDSGCSPSFRRVTVRPTRAALREANRAIRGGR
jgi:hypothetical protein